MHASGFQLCCLGDERLAPLATSTLPAWLWSVDASRLLWANSVGAAIFGAATAAAIRARAFDTGHPAAAQIARLAPTLRVGAPARLERLRAFGASLGRPLTSACSCLRLDGGTDAILVVAAERAGPDLPLAERLRRLIGDGREAVAAFAPDGALLAAGEGAKPYLNGATTLEEIGAQTFAAEALANGRAAGNTLTIDRIGVKASTALVVSFAAHDLGVAKPIVETSAASPAVEVPVAKSFPAPEKTSSGRRYPLRFVWQMDEADRFTVGTDEFAALVGGRTAAAIGRTWPDMAADLGLDPAGQIARALATRDTWSALTVAWPVDDSTEPLAVELSGLPVFDRERTFRGYRGFGVCRDVERLAALARQRRRSPVCAQPAEQNPNREAIQETARETAQERNQETNQDANQDANQEADQVRHQATIRGTSQETIHNSPPDPVPQPVPALSAQPTPPERARPVENVVPFRSTAEPGTPALSAIERNAFRELSRNLSQRLTAAGIKHNDATAIPAPDEDHAAEIEALPIETLPIETLPIEAVALAAERGMQPMLDKLPVGILLYRLDQLIYANPAFLQWSGHQSLDALSAAGGLDELFVGPLGAAVASGDKSLKLALDRGDGISVASELIAIDWEGEPAQALVIANPAREGENLKRAQAEIAELEAILDTAADGVVTIDRQGRIVSANRSVQALFGYTAQELCGRAFDDLFAPESLDAARDSLDDLVRDATSLGGGREVVGRLRAGGSIALFMTTGRIGDGAEKLCAAFRDTTAWKKSAEDLLAAKRQAEDASSAKSEFLAKVSHEIRTPLNAILGFSEVMMEERFGPVTNERYRDYLKDIHASGGHLLSLVNDLLDLSKIEAGKLELAFTSVALNELTQQCVAIMQPQANRERIIIRTSLAHALPQVVADVRSVRQIVLNLLSNSIKFTGAGGQVIVSTARDDNGDVVLRVRDTGVGMSEKDLLTALEPFRQIATSGRSGGTGLGLPLTKALAQANRATFRINSTPKEGTLVEIAFPAERTPAP